MDIIGWGNGNVDSIPYLWVSPDRQQSRFRFESAQVKPALQRVVGSVSNKVDLTTKKGKAEYSIKRVVNLLLEFHKNSQMQTLKFRGQNTTSNIYADNKVKDVDDWESQQECLWVDSIEGLPLPR